MDTFQLTRRLAIDTYTKNIVVGVVPKDELPGRRLTAYPTAFVCNTDDGDEPGEHWVAVYVDAGPRGTPTSAPSFAATATRGRTTTRDCRAAYLTCSDNIASPTCSYDAAVCR